MRFNAYLVKSSYACCLYSFVHQGISFFDLSSYIIPYPNVLPLTFEALDLAYGYLWYQTDVTGIASADNILDLGVFHDRASVYVDRVMKVMVFYECLPFQFLLSLSMKVFLSKIYTFFCISFTFLCFQEYQGTLKGSYGSKLVIRPGKTLDIIVSYLVFFFIIVDVI